LPDRKVRTRAHVIEDYSANHIERIALSLNFAYETVGKDYGIDGNIYTFNSLGEIENGRISVQLKATDHLKVKNNHIVFPLKAKDINYWCNEFDPVLLIVYDAKSEKGYWFHIQKEFPIAIYKKGKTIKILLSQTFDKEALKNITQIKNSLYTNA
jgi:hypothetical protein